MATIESIGPTGKYPSIQAWYDDHAGDITSDPNAPYIGELEPGFLVGDVDIGNATPSVTDADHYFHLRAKPSFELHGDFNFTKYQFPVVRPANVSSIGFRVDAAYTRLENFAIGTLYTTKNAYTVVHLNAENILLDGMGVWRVNTTVNVLTCNMYIIRVLQDNVCIRNSSIAHVRTANLNAAGYSRIYGISVNTTGNVYIYNNSTHYIHSMAVSGSFQNYAVHIINGQYKIHNNCIGYQIPATTFVAFKLDGGSGTISNNACGDSTGGDDSILIDEIDGSWNEYVDPTEPNLHMNANAQGRGAGLNLISGGYDNAPLIDCDGTSRPTAGAWDIGIDYPNDIVVLARSDQNSEVSSVVFVPGATNSSAKLIRNSLPNPTERFGKKLNARMKRRKYYDPKDE